MSAIPKAPAGLKLAGRRLWRSIVVDYQLEPFHLAILKTACECVDRIEEARAAVEAEGLTIEGRFGAKAHPALAVERDSRVALLRALRELSLDTATAESYARPPRIVGRYH